MYIKIQRFVFGLNYLLLSILVYLHHLQRTTKKFKKIKTNKDNNKKKL